MALGNEVGRIFYALDLDSSRFRAGLSVAGDEAEGLGNKFKTVGKVIADTMLAASAAAVGFGALSVKAYAESEAIGAQLNQVLQTTGKVSQISKAQVEALAMSMENYSGKSHDAIEQGQTLLLQFSQVTKENLPQFTKAMLDLSQRMGVDTVTAAKQLGIALDDPTTGMARLRRSGIDFTKDQKETIKSLQASGDIAGADAKLMDALSEKVGGAASAYRNTLSGSIASAKNSLKDFEIAVGSTISTSLEPLATKAANALASIDWEKVAEHTANAIKDVYKEVDNFIQRVEIIYDKVYNFLEPSLAALWNTISTKVLPTLEDLWHNVIEPLIPVIGVLLAAAVWLVINALNIFLAIVTPLMDFLLSHKVVLDILAGAFIGLAASMAFNAAFNALTVGFNVLRLVTIPSVIASVEAMQAVILAPLVMPAIAVGAAIASLMAVRDAAFAAMDAVNNTLHATESAGNSDEAAMRKVIAGYKNGTISQAQYQAFFSHLAGRATGGPVNAMTPYIVGENGPELYIPKVGGQIIPNNIVQGLLSKISGGVGSKPMAGSDTYISNQIGSITISKEADGEAWLQKLTRSDQLISMGLSG